MGGWWTPSYYVGIMPDGSVRYFVSDAEYYEAYMEALEDEN